MSNNQYKIIAVLWMDHVHMDRSPLPRNLEQLNLKPTLTVGVQLQDTDEALIVASDLERYDDRDDISYTVILKGTIVSIKEYGIIEIDGLKTT